MSEPEPQDVITYEQKTVEIVKEREKVEMFYDQGYWPILVILRDGHLTVREMTEKSNILIEKKVKPQLDKKFKDYQVTKEKFEELFKKASTFTEEEKKSLREKKTLSDSDVKLVIDRIKEYKLSKEQKSEKTIYRYVKDLTQAELIVAAGQRVVIGKTATETLYTRKAKIFILRQHSDDTWKCEECKSTLGKVGKMIALSLQIKQPKVECLAKLMSTIDMYHEDEQIRLFEQYDDEIKEIIKDCSFKETNHLLATFRTIYMLLKADEFKDEMKECFE
ncbi:MAG: hypothetical protein GOP50_10330 [Candidatus Heimdallarchaeota archaeon]|nr:hypothetical protein [Candidatus Heimdallarchaeota archaeon]